MTTARDVINKALQNINVVEAGETPVAVDTNDGLDTLNQMLHGLKPQGADIGFANLALDSEIPMPPEHIRAVRLVLAIELSSDHGVDVPPELAIQAQRGLNTLQAAYSRIPELKMDPGLRNRMDDFYGNEGFDGT